MFHSATISGHSESGIRTAAPHNATNIYEDDSPHLSSTHTSNVGGDGEALLPKAQSDRFSNLLKRNSLLSAAMNNNRNPHEFYADYQLTPIQMNGSIYNILQSAPGLRATKFQWRYAIAYHGKLTHTWSLLQIGTTLDTTYPVLRPIACLETSGPNCKMSESIITDLKNPLDAQKLKVVHLKDSWQNGGYHTAFQLDFDYRYEWEYSEMPPGSGNFGLYLWRIDMSDPKSVVPAARIICQGLIKHPTKLAANSDSLWAVELDVDRIPPHVAILSAFNMKACHSRWHSWFASKITVIPPPMPLLNFAFQNDTRTYQQQEKFWGDWNDVEHFSNNRQKKLIIPVFNKSYLAQFALPQEIINMLNVEAAANCSFFKMTYGIREYSS